MAATRLAAALRIKQLAAAMEKLHAQRTKRRGKFMLIARGYRSTSS
jgi:hypothetical protein